MIDVDEAMVDAETVGHLRAVAKRVTGGNCAFAIDDANLLGALAARAIDAGLTSGIRGRYTIVNMERARGERARDSGSRPEGEDSRSEAECEARQSGAAKTAHRPNHGDAEPLSRGRG